MNILKFFSNNKTLSIIILLALLIFTAGVIGNQLIEKKINNWANGIEKKVNSIEVFASQKIHLKQQKLTALKNELLSNLVVVNESNFEEFQKVLSDVDNEAFTTAIYKNDELFYWSNNYLEQLTIDDTLKFDYGETYFLESDINSYLIVKDTFSVKDNYYQIYLAQIVEKQYRLNEDYFSHINLATEISKNIDSEVKIDYSPTALKDKDGRKHSFEIKNSNGNIIGMATFLKPSRESSVKDLEDLISTIQGLLALIGYLLIGYLLKTEVSKQTSKFLVLFAITVYLLLLRYLLILIKFPHNLLSTELLNAKYYFSNFGNGLAYSPIDLSITLLIIFLLVLFYFRYSLISFNSIREEKNTINILSILVFIFGVIIYLIFLRGVGAAIRGLVFDSSLRYFQSTSLIFSQPHFLMHVNILLIGLISMLGSASIIVFILSFFRIGEEKSWDYKAVSFLAILFFIGELFYTNIQDNPQLTLSIKFIQITFVFVSVYLIAKYDYKKITKVIIFFLGASIFSISSLLYYNAELEKVSLKTTASIISRVDDSWYKDLISETILSNFSRREAIKSFSKKNTNYNGSAFKIWSNSKLQNEAINSSINFISLSGELLGGFGSIYPKLTLDKFIDTNSVIEEIQIFEEAIDNESQKLIRGIFPVKDEFAFLGYLDVSILSDLNDFGFSSHPDFISAGKLNDKSIHKLDKLIILDYRNEELKVVYGNLNPTQIINHTILNAEFSSKNDAWINAEFNGAEYLVYVKRTIPNNISRIIAVALREKELSIGLFDFFKIFFTHSLVLLLILVGYILFYSSSKLNYQLDLRSKLLLAFLIISVIPLILTAFYFRNLTEEKNDDAIYYKLGKRAFSIENYINDNNNNRINHDIYVKASKDLNINYAIYSQNRLEYSSHELLYDVGLLPKNINPVAFNELINDASQEVLVKESVDKFKFNSFYYKANILGEEIIIKVSDGFNNIRLPLSGSEVDVFLFGIYSLAVVLIIIFSALFANQISLPIRRITSATKSVAAGDLSLKLKTDAKGELGELVSGFQYMLKELKKNQTMLAEIEREEAWKEMAKQVAHEIKNPLTPMKLSVQQLVTTYNDKSDKFDDFFQKVTRTILNQIETLKNIATEFSNFARMPKVIVEDIDCVDVIKRAINLFTDEKIKISLTHDQDKTIISGDADQLKRTVINILRNSIQAGATEIILKLNETESSYELIVNDNGRGISDEHLAKIFEPNFTTKKDGMGLGLSMARRYLRSTGGDINIENSSQKGTTIKLIFHKSL
jgi:signal transduction histidine kinase